MWLSTYQKERLNIMKNEEFLKYFEGKDLSKLTQKDLEEINVKINAEQINPLLKDKDSKIEQIKVEQSKKVLENESLNKKLNELSNEVRQMKEQSVVADKINKVKNINHKLSDDKIAGVILLADNLIKIDPNLSYDQAVDKIMDDYKLKETSFTYKGSSLNQNLYKEVDSSQ
jgi:hypothetical protein